MQNNTCRVSLPFVTFLSLFLIGCSSQASSNTPEYANNTSKVIQTQLTDKDIFEEEVNKEITDYDIQEAAYEAKKGFKVPLHSSIIVAQSGATVPDTDMQLELSKYYQVSVYSGISKTKNPTNRRKSKEGEPPVNNNYMRQLRLIAAKGGQSTIVIYWGTIEKGVFNEATNLLKWSPYEGGKLPNQTKSLRYLLKFTLVDVITGNWSSYSPTNIEVTYTQPKIGNNINDADQISELMKQTYQNAATLLSEKYKGKTR